MVPAIDHVAVLGAGGWGTAFALLLADAGRSVSLWARDPRVADAINIERRNERRLPGIELPVQVRATADRSAAVADADAVVVALPSQTVRANMTGWALPRGVPVVSLAKGLEEGTGLRMSRVLAECGVAPDQIAVLSGPNLADEIGRREPASAVVAAAEHDLAVDIQRACHGPNFRAYTSTDVTGVEVGGVTKNSIAIAVGMAIGLGLGANAVAALTTRGLAESTRLGEAMGADPLTFQGMAGMGDLVATCFSPLSRNRSFGVELGRGVAVEAALAHGRGVVEGARSTPVVAQVAGGVGVDMPVVSTVCDVLAGLLTPAEALERAMARELKPER